MNKGRLNTTSAFLLVGLFTVACSDSSNNDNSGSTPLADCPDDYVVGTWFYSGDTVRTTLEYSDEGEYSSVQALNGFDDPFNPGPPPFLTYGTYELGNLVTNENGLEVCEIQLIIGDDPPANCLQHVYVDGDVLYESSCDLQLDFDVAYDRVDGEPAG
jgi:hypothetical protein